MKNIKILMILLCFGVFNTMQAQKYYDDQWKKVSVNYQKGTYKSNIPIILDIQKNAMKDNNMVQLIQSLKAEFSILNQTSDDDKNNAVSKFFQKLNNTEKSLKGEGQMVYHVLLNTFFIDYYNHESWKINGRTNINSQDISQIETWSKLDFKNYFNKSFAQLDTQKSEMERISLSKYKEAFSDAKDVDYFSTLLDWYLLRKIYFLHNNELFTTNEVKENKTEISTIYDELIAKNTGNSKLYFIYDKLLDNCDFKPCKDRLEQLHAIVNSEIDGDYKVFIMDQIMNEMIMKNDADGALKIANQARKMYPKSLFLENIKNKENEIINPSLNLQYEDNIQSNLPIHLVADYRNISEFSLQIYEVKDNLKDFMKEVSQYNHRYGINSLDGIKKTFVRSESYQLKAPQDHKNHITSLEIKPLPSGIYIAEFIIEKEKKSFYMIATNSKIIYKNKKDRNDYESEMKLVNSDSGQAIANQELIFHEIPEDDNAEVNKINGKTDENGIFKLPQLLKKEYYRKFLVQETKTNDFHILNVYGENNNYDFFNKQNSSSAQIFTDRAIYRPGQTVYFKVINTKINNKVESVVTGLKQKITLKDANEQDVSSQNFTTNDFGSYHGSFILPKGKLNGSFTIRVDGESKGYKYITVEEYKRPKFEVTFEPVKDEYKYGQTIEVKGKAMMFSGVSLNNVSVDYSIRKFNIRWKYFSWYPEDYGDNNENLILGQIKTNDKGEFVIRVELKKDESLEGIQVNNYEIGVSVTDINGETQTGNTNLQVASVSHLINADKIGNAFTDENVKVKIETQNYNEQTIKKPYQIKLSKLKSPERIFRQNFNSAVQNIPTYSKSEFINKFPHDYYDKNDDKANTKPEKVIVEKTQQPSKDDIVDFGKLEAGDYQLELFNIEGKDTIKANQKFSVWHKGSLQPQQKVFLEVIEPKNKFTRGEKVKIYAYSAIPDGVVNVFVQDGYGNMLSEMKRFQNGVLEYIVDIPQNKEVSFVNVQFQVVAFNDVQTKSAILEVKDSEQPLKIETVTFRDKIEPNSKEKWSVKVVGNDKEKINAEVLAGMYDMSLDHFQRHEFNWQNLYEIDPMITYYDVRQNLSSQNYTKQIKYGTRKDINVPAFNWFSSRNILNALQGKAAGITVYSEAAPAPPRSYKPKMRLLSVRMDDEAINILNSGRQLTEQEKKEYADVYDPTAAQKARLGEVPIRQNLNETAFFYPDLKTDSEGNVSFEFTSPEALTKWKLMFLAHTKDARAATLEKEVVTQKEFSVTPNYPRFLREGDELNLQSKLSNLTNKKLNGSASLQILDAFTNEDISSHFGLISSIQNFDLNENENSALTWKIKVPKNVSSIILKVVAKAGQYSDGEQKAVAILPNRMLVTDAVPIFVKEGETKTFELENLKNANSTTISNVSNTLELTTNPIWEIMFALPSLKNDQNNSADVVFNKWFADVLASEIFKANPKIKTVFEEYQNKGLLNSNLEKNQELKQLLLDETPWVLESKSETEQMAKLSLLFDINNMRNTIESDWDDFKKLQNPDGGFSWYQGYPSSYSTSLYILKNLGKINSWLKDNVKDYQSSEQNKLIKNLISYVDNEISKYSDIKEKNIWTNWTLDYLDTRNYWEKQYPLKGNGATLKSLVKQKAKTAKITDFTFLGLHRAALLMSDYGLKDVSDKLMNYLKETSVDSKTQGVYWKQNLDDWGWFSSKVVNHAGALEAFNKLKPNDQKFIEDMKIWLITQKEVNSWGSSRGTSEVIFTILNSGKLWTSADSDKATVIWGGKELKPETQATGYVKSTVKTDLVDKKLATVTVTKPGVGIVQGGLFWQYYEDLDKITSSENYISVTKELYKKIKTVNGEELQKLSSETPLKVGDKVTVRMILNTDRAMEFIHIKDMRAAGFEPLDVLSGYQWKNNLGYYQSTKDASMNFYIQNMPKGKYVFEYDYVANASGKFSNGITTIQNYYAPQMNAHTKGTNVQISE